MMGIKLKGKSGWGYYETWHFEVTNKILGFVGICAWLFRDIFFKRGRYFFIDNNMKLK